ncbi:FKBP-type peptidyl-prolyl cis-trans isomerase [Carboxylicivirga sediminis]|uniref:Peptidyl-prolyl cis-trans isomerase n=1 Tax=Carboxylicivirga sediminis TaxID=2006564 RepID=A0A941F1I4_9BACT|nr:FKBP-type peptidyl-prolyl cis-trans isomerase [Carboxylicivirga sediminis]MBR8534669.1 FKBP-type peptidyl-prolyl cis-trans isomerase [Carboxylicivirga sediminis]
MKNIFTKSSVAITLLVALALTQACNTPDSTATLSSKADSLSYGYGVMMARQLASEANLNADMVAAGIREALNESAQMTMDEASQAITMAKAQVGIDFLAENATKEGVQTTESGLQYKVIEEGTGASPLATDEVKVHYKGSLINGEVFDSSEGSEPISFPLNRVIPGWTEGLQLMKEGGKTIFYIPYQLAYGERGAGQVIPPYSALIFEVELIKVGSN